MAVRNRSTAACDGRPVIVSPTRDQQCLSAVSQTDAQLIRAYSLRVLASSKDIYTRFNHHFPLEYNRA